MEDIKTIVALPGANYDKLLQQITNFIAVKIQFTDYESASKFAEMLSPDQSTVRVENIYGGGGWVVGAYLLITTKLES